MQQTLRSLIILVTLSLSSLGGVAFAAPSELIGKVYDIQSQELLYQESHRFNGTSMQTTYTDATGEMIGQRDVEFNQGRVKTYTLTQDVAATSETVARKDGSILLSVTDNGKQKQKEIDSRKLDEVVIDAGFSNFIVRNWDTLMANEKVTTHFASAAQLDLIKVQIRRVDPSKTSLAKMGDPTGIVTFQMQLANPLIRWLISPIEVGYYADTKQVAFYQGASNLSRPSGEHYGDVRVQFERQSNAVALSAQ